MMMINNHNTLHWPMWMIMAMTIGYPDNWSSMWMKMMMTYIPYDDDDDQGLSYIALTTPSHLFPPFGLQHVQLSVLLLDVGDDDDGGGVEDYDDGKRSEDECHDHDHYCYMQLSILL